MEATETSAPPRWFWIVSILGLLWMLIGVSTLVMDFMTMTDESALASMSDMERELYESRPTWLFIVYAISTLGGLAGTIGLLVRKGWAVSLLALSLAAVVVQFGYILVDEQYMEFMGPAQALTLPAIIFLIGALLLWFSARARGNGWIG